MYNKKPISDKFNRKKTNQNDLNRFQNIHQKIVHKLPKITYKELPIPSYSLTNIFNEGDVNRLKKKQIHKIFHVYQSKYANDLYPTGLGDFIRSCFFIYQFCNKYGFQCEIIINHPIAQFLNNFSNTYLPNSSSSIILNNNVFMFSDTNWYKSVFNNQNYIERFLLVKEKLNFYIDYLCSLPVINCSVFSYNILFPYHDISLEECNKIRYLFQPSREIIEKVNEHLSNLTLIKNKFSVIHIRSGDCYLKNDSKIFSSIYYERIKNEIIEIIFKEKNNDILLIADNNEIKLLINHEFPSIKFLVYNITHIGEGIELETEKVKNTIIDFYLMSNSYSIYSLTSYPHGSGFSCWCAKMYDIPYKCKYIS